LKPIKLSLLWHQHQPYYRTGNEFRMPWAWLHATKDYLEMAEHFERHPEMRGTINLVPSLIKQIEEYIAGDAYDRVLDLMTKDAGTLWAGDQLFMLDNFFITHRERFIDRSPRYRELYEKAYFAGAEPQSRFDIQDYRDLAVHYSLAWTGEISRGREPFKSLVEKDRGYSEEDKQLLAKAQMENVRRIIPLHRELAERKQIELTTSPFYHPILPLLINTDSAREAMPNVPLPNRRFHAPEEANEQIHRAREFFNGNFGVEPKGMWPSEGSLSWEAITLIRKNGFEWTATDEAVLHNSINAFTTTAGNITIKAEHAKYFPWRAETSDGEIVLFFRDHSLSDDIGFTYQTWDAGDAVEHFVQNILRIRSDLLTNYGEDVLHNACISVILDGENCWEYYYNNGFEFLDKLYSALGSTPEIQPVTFSDAISGSQHATLPHLTTLTAGSWIQGNFQIWIGHPEDNAAWYALYDAKAALDSARAENATGIDGAHEELMIAEGSDWCWWYGDEHFSVQQDIFDELYRMHLSEVYRKLDIPVPENLTRPISGRFSNGSTVAKYGAMQRAT
jgi:alpha-amylase/alpha-mannosidase (GH57 family)